MGDERQHPDLMSMTAAAHRAGWSLARFREFCRERRLLIDNGGGPKRGRYEVKWSEFEVARDERPRVLSFEAETKPARQQRTRRLMTNQLHADVRC